MRLSSIITIVFFILITTVTATGQFATPEYKSPITIRNMDVTYEVNADGTYTMDTVGEIRIDIDQAV